MKKIIRSIALLIAISLLGITDTHAYSVGDVFYKGIRDLGVWPLKFDNGDGYGDNLYTGRKAGESRTHNIYCLDPGARDGSDLIVKRVLMADGSPKAEDYGMIQILTADINDTSVNPHGLSEDRFSFARSVAIRTFINGYLHWANGASNDDRVAAFEKTSDYWTTGKGSPGIVANNSNNNNRELGNQVMESAELLFQRAREARNNYKDTELPTVEVKLVSQKEVRDQAADSDMSIPTPVEPVDPDAPVTVTKNFEYIVEFKIENFSEDAQFIWLAETDNRASTDIEYEYEVVGLGYENTGSVDDLRIVGLWDNREIWQYLKGQATQHGDLYDVTFYVGVKVTATATEEQIMDEGIDCTGLIDLKFKYEDPNLFHGVVLYGRSDSGIYVNNEQRFVFGVHEPVEDKFTITFNGCGVIACDPIGMLPQVCEDGLEADENGNVEYVYRESFVTADGLTGSYNIRKCVLKNPTDVAGNSLKLRDNADAKRVSNNPYCSILCKEDYRFVVPYKRQVTPGRYFQIETSLKGQQECYSDEFNYEQYVLDLREAIDNLVEEVNNWGMWHELSENGLSGDCEHSDECYIVTCEEDCDDENPDDCDCDEGSDVCQEQYKQKVTFDQNANYYTTNSSDPYDLTVYPSTYDAEIGWHYDFGEVKTPETIGNCGSGCSESGHEHCTFTTPQEDYDSQVPDFESARADSATEIENLVQEIKKIIDNYNFCVGDDNYEEYAEVNKNGDNSWEMIYDFHPRISYSYDEPDPTKTDGTGEAKWISQVQSFTCEEGTCDYMHIKEIEINAEDCTGLDDCNEVDKVESIHPTVEGGDEYEELNVNEYCIDDINNDYTCVGQTLTTIDENSYEEKMYWVCDASDETNVTCQEEPFDLTKIKFVHKTAVASATLDTPRVYYSGHDDGNIMISTGRAPDNFTKVDGLPVSVNTPENTYPYILGFEDIGKFYSEDKLGRIYGVSDQSLAKWNKDNLSTNIFSDTKTSVTITTSDSSAREIEIEANKYACTYELFNSCVDSDGVRHTSDECRYGEDEPDWNACKERLCPTSEDSGYCVQQAEAYYVCKNQFYKEDECTPYDTRAEALAITGPENNYNCCPNCTIECVGSCLYVLHNDYVNDGELLVDFRPISTSNINPNNRTIGYNWQTVNASNRLMSIKAGLTISEIEERARKGADVNDPDFEIIDDYTLKVKMTPEMITYIKEYNNEQIDEGSYNNNTLECDDYDLNNIYSTEDDCTDAGYNWHDDKCVMANIFCYSTFIDELIAEFNQGGEVLVDAPGREAAKDAAWRNYTVASSTQIPGEVEDIVTNNYWTIYQFTELDINNDGRPDVGPSWK